MRLIEDTMNPHGKAPAGLYQPKSDAEYRSVARLNPSAIAAGLMSNLEIDPTLIRSEYEATKKPPTAAAQDRMDRGTLAHLFILQPELVESRVAVWYGDRRSGKEWNDFVLANDGRLLIRDEDYREVKMACDQVLNVPRVRNLFAGCEAEVALYGSDRDIFTKGRVDAVKRGELSVIVDLKTTEAGIDSRSVQRTIREFHYREKMAMYRRMLCQATGANPEMAKCFNVFVKLPPPISIRIVQFSTAALEFGEMRMMKALESVRDCIKRNSWPVFVGDDISDVDYWECPEEETQIDY